MSIHPNFFSEVRTFIDEHRMLCVSTLGLAILGYAIGNLAGRAVTWLRDYFGTTEKTQQVAQNFFSEEDKRIVEESGKNLSETPSLISPLQPSDTRDPNTPPYIFPSQQETEMPHSESPVHQYTPLSLNDLKNLGSLKQITVLSQTYRWGGENECGFHAFKNALVGASLGFGIQNITQQDFEKPETFVEIFNWVKKSKGNTDGDASIAELHQAFLKLGQAKPEDLTPILGSFQTLTKEKAISIINIAENWMTGDGELAISADADTLSYLCNLKELSHKPGPWTHAFVIGSDGHWITLIAQKDEIGSMKWFGTDSWHNQTVHFHNHLNLLQAVINNSKSEDWWKTQYDNAIGDWIRHKSHWTNEQGDISNLENRQSLLNEKSRDDYVHRIINGFDFMKTAGWLEGDLVINYQEDIAALRKLAICFQKAEAENRPELAAKLGSIAEELGKA